MVHTNSSVHRGLRSNGRLLVKTELTPRWVRVVYQGETIADSKRVIVLHERGNLPVYYFPEEDVKQQFLVPSEQKTHCPLKGDASYWSIHVNGHVSEHAVWSYENPIEESEAIRGYRAFYWDKVDAWYEEDEQIYVHPRDPYKRVDAIQSSRHVEIFLGGYKIADSTRPVIVFETGVPVRYYLPIEDIDSSRLTATTKQTSCPYKGTAQYWNVEINGQVHDNIVWSYPNPIPEIPKIKGLLSFYNERVEVLVDGVKQPEPVWYRSALEFFNETEVTAQS